MVVDSGAKSCCGPLIRCKQGQARLGASVAESIGLTITLP